jgi:hypothetical protein
LQAPCCMITSEIPSLLGLATIHLRANSTCRPQPARGYSSHNSFSHLVLRLEFNVGWVESDEDPRWCVASRRGGSSSDSTHPTNSSSLSSSASLRFPLPIEPKNCGDSVCFVAPWWVFVGLDPPYAPRELFRQSRCPPIEGTPFPISPPPCKIDGFRHRFGPRPGEVPFR